MFRGSTCTFECRLSLLLLLGTITFAESLRASQMATDSGSFKYAVAAAGDEEDEDDENCQVSTGVKSHDTEEQRQVHVGNGRDPCELNMEDAACSQPVSDSQETVLLAEKDLAVEDPMDDAGLSLSVGSSSSVSTDKLESPEDAKQILGGQDSDKSEESEDDQYGAAEGARDGHTEAAPAATAAAAANAACDQSTERQRKRDAGNPKAKQV